eukprot:g13077.t2
MESDALLSSNRQVASGGAGGGRQGVLPSSASSSIFTSSACASPSSSERLIARAPSDGLEGRAALSDRARPPSLLTRQEEVHSDDSFWENADVATAVSRDLVDKAKRWKQLAGEPLALGSTNVGGNQLPQLPEVTPVLTDDIDKHEVASIFVKDALAGRESSACIHNSSSLRALKLVRNKAWNQLLNVCTIIHLIFPMVEVPRCLPCLGVQKLPDYLDPASLREGWWPTALGSTWAECLLCLLYVYDLRQENLSKSGVRVADGGNDGGAHGKPDGGRPLERSSSATLFALPPWQLARTCMVAFLALGLLTNVFSHYVFGITWHSWGRVMLPFLFISRRTYLKHFVAGMVRVVPRRASNMLQDLDLFGEPTSSALTFLRIFTAKSYMLDVEIIFGGRKDAQVMVLSYAVIMVMFLGALIPAVANRNFQHQSRESYYWVKEQRTLALTRAYMLLKQPDGSVAREDWVRLMECLRPDCNAEHTSALFGAAKKAEQRPIPSLSTEDDRNRMSKAGFFMLCALGTANFSQGKNEREKLHRPGPSAGPWTRFRLWLDAVFSWSPPGGTFPLSQQVLNVALLVQGYQIVREGDDPEGRPAWAYPLGGVLIGYFCLHSISRMITTGPRTYMGEWRHALGMVLNLVGVAYYTGLWFRGEAFHSLYQIIQASRLIVLWDVLYLLGPTTSEVARRLEFVSPSVIRASVVLFAVTYSYSVVAYGLFCATPMGQQPIDTVKDNSMVQRFAAVKEVASFGSLHQSFASLLYVIMLSNWPMFMDAAGDVKDVLLARLFFYSFKVLTFYIVMPLTIGFIVQSYMAAQMPGSQAGTPAFSTTQQTSDGSTLLTLSRRSYTKADGENGEGAGGEGGEGGGGGGGGGRGGEDMHASQKNAAAKQGGSSTRKYDGSMFGFSTLADGSDTELGIAALASDGGGTNGSEDVEQEGGRESAGNGIADVDRSSWDDDILAPVMVASRNRAMSQQFWGLEHAKEASAAQEDDSIRQEMLDRLRDENTVLKDDNARLRALVDNMQHEMGASGATATPSMAEPSPAATGSLRSRVISSNNVIWGMRAISEAEDEEAELLPSRRNAAGGGGGGGSGFGTAGDDGGRGTPPARRSGGAMGETRSFTIPLVMPGISTLPRDHSAAGFLPRQPPGDEANLSAEAEATADLATAISRDLVKKAERWKALAGEQLESHGFSQMPLLGYDVDKYDVASVYVRDALAGRESSAIMHNKSSLRSLKIFRNNAWNQLLNACTIVHLILPMIEIQRCLPCLAMAQLPNSPDANALHIGWRPTALGSMWIESIMCVLYAYHARQEALARLGDVPDRVGQSVEEVEEDTGIVSGYRRRRPEEYSLFALPPWQLARTVMVTLISLSLIANISCHYIFGVTWFSWRHMILPFLFISRRTYLKHFVTAVVRLLPRMLPVVFLISFITFFYGFLGYIVYHHEPHPAAVLSNLNLFDNPVSSAMTFLRIFTARSFMLDLDKLYNDRGDMEVMVLTYGVIMFIFLLALVPAVATHNFNGLSRESYYWVKEQRKLALTRAFLLLKQPDGTLMRGDYVQLMKFLRPDCDEEHTSALFGAAKRAEVRQFNNVLTFEDDRNKISKAGFFQLCALGTADFSRRRNARMKIFRSRSTGRRFTRVRRQLDAALTWSRPGSNFPVSQQVLNLALLVQGYQIVEAGDDPEGRPAWVYPLGAALLAYFTIQAVLRMIAAGPREHFVEWRNVFEMSLNVIGMVFYGGLWPRGVTWHNIYQLLQASRLELLWNYLHLLGPLSSGVATRLEFVFPSVIRAGIVLFSVYYSFTVVAYAMYCSTPLGVEPLGSLKDDSMAKSFAGVKEVASFASLPQSFESMMYIVMFSNWPMFMDAAGEVGSQLAARIFFYSFKVIGFYFLFPVMLGSSVTAYLNVQVPDADSKKPASATATPSPRRRPSSATRSSFDEEAGDGGTGSDDGRYTLTRHISFGEDIASRALDGNKFGYANLHDEDILADLVAQGAVALNKDDEGENGGRDGGDVNRRSNNLSDTGPGRDRDRGVARVGGTDAGERNAGGGTAADSSGSDGTAVDDDSVCESDGYAPLMVASRTRSLSQTFWAHHQAADGGTHASTTMQGEISRLEAEIVNLRVENSSLRRAIDAREAAARLYVADMDEELQASAADATPSTTTRATPSLRRAGVGVGVVNAAGRRRGPMFGTSPEVAGSLRNRVVSSANTIWGMNAILETENGHEEEKGDGHV